MPNVSVVVELAALMTVVPLQEAETDRKGSCAAFNHLAAKTPYARIQHYVEKPPAKTTLARDWTPGVARPRAGPALVGDDADPTIPLITGSLTTTPAMALNKGPREIEHVSRDPPCRS